jgi:hypothetical protein
VARWVASGAAALTGSPGRPAALVSDAVLVRMAALGGALDVDVFSLVTERAHLMGLRPGGHESCGGAARLLRAADGWVVVQLARPDDRDAVPAWLDIDADRFDPSEPWGVVPAEVARRRSADLVEQACLLGMPVAALGEVPVPSTPVIRSTLPGRRTRRAVPLVVDLSSLWAGPLCARLLGERGCRVVKVESAHRPDGARAGHAGFYDRLHPPWHESVVVDLRSHTGRTDLHRLLADADMVIEGSRPRALRQLGLDVETLGTEGPAVWISITGYGRTGDGAGRVAFGDDAAVAGGLVAWDDDRPCFVADAVADPLSGIAAAAAAVDAVQQRDERVLLDVPMAGVAAWVAGESRR